MNFIHLELRAAGRFLGRIWRVCALLLASFVLAAAAAHAVCTVWFTRDPAQLQQAIAAVAQMFDQKELINEVGQIDALRLFANNLRAAGLMLLLGALPFIFLPALLLLFNAAIIGAVTAGLFLTTEVGPGFLVLSLLPHGVPEILAIILSASMGMMICRELSARIWRPHIQRPSLGGLLYDMLRLFVLCVVPLLAAAAVIEAYVTPALAALAL